MRMPTDDEPTAAPSSTTASQALARIAKTLGCTVEEVATGSRAASELAGAAELLALWNAMPDASRTRLLAFARTLAVG